MSLKCVKWLFAMHSQASGTRQIFSYWDEPAISAIFNISIKHHKDYIALSNMREKNTK